MVVIVKSVHDKNKRLVITVEMLFIMSKTLVKMAINCLCLNK